MTSIASVKPHPISVAICAPLFSLTCPRPGGIAGADGLTPPLPRCGFGVEINWDYARRYAA